MTSTGPCTALVLLLCGCGSTAVAPDAPIAPEASPPSDVKVPEAAPAVVRPQGATPTRVPIEGVVDLSVGSQHACAVDRQGQVWCWGNGRHFRLGRPIEDASPRPVRVEGIGRAIAVAAGGATSCALMDDRSVACWGGYRQVPGDEDGIDWPSVKRPEVVAWPVAWTQQVTAGWTQATLLDASGRVSILDAMVGPVPLERFSPLVQVASLGDGFCGRTREGRIECVTSSESGSSGTGGAGGYGEEPAAVRPALTWVEEPQATAARTGLRAAFVDADGNPSYAPCAAAEGEEDKVPSWCRETMVGARDLDAEGDLACAVTQDSEVACWGCADCWDDNKPPLGLPEGILATLPIRIPGPSAVVEVAVGGRHLCTRHQDGTVRCWGDDKAGQLGPNGRGASATPVLVPGLGDVTEIDAGTSTTCARTAAGEVWCWGHPLGTRWRETDAAHADDEADDTWDGSALERPMDPVAGPASPGPEAPCREVEVYGKDGSLTELRHGYDAKGRRSATQEIGWRPDMTQLHDERAFRRDAQGNVTRETRREHREDGTIHTSSVTYRYDPNGHVTWKKGRNTVDDELTTFGYDARGRLATVKARWRLERITWSERRGLPGTRWDGMTVEDADLQTEWLPMGEERVVRIARDAAGRVVGQRVRIGDGEAREEWTTRDASGRVTMVTETWFDVPFYEEPRVTWETRFAYDASGRVIGRERTEVDGTERAVVSRVVISYTGCLLR